MQRSPAAFPLHAALAGQLASGCVRLKRKAIFKTKGH
jgi:hypothetical protein